MIDFIACLGMILGLTNLILSLYLLREVVR